jgi:hypothetical protein
MVQSVSDIAYQAEQRKIRAARESARAEPLTDAEIVEGLRKQSDAKSWWIETHGSTGRWPQAEVDRKRHELRVLVQAADRIKIIGGAHEPGPS